MNTRPISTSSLCDILSCWVYRNHQYDYFEAGHATPILPAVDASYKPILDELGIPYRESMFGDYEFWDPDCYEETDVTLPLFVQMSYDEFRFIKKAHTGKLVTTETTDAAFKLLEVIEALRTEHYENAHQSALLNGLKAFLNGNIACGINYNKLEYILPIDTITLAKDEKLELKNGHDHILVLPVYTLISEERLLELRARCIGCCMNPNAIDPRLTTNYIAVFDMNKLNSGDIVDLWVSKGTEAIFIGRGGWQVKKWCEQLGGLTKINVKSSK